MIDIAIMIEGQDGLTWPRWQRIAETVEDSGFAGLYRSDHFTNSNPPDKDSLECWTSLTWLASHTKRIHFGPLVSPFSVRHPVLLARMALAVDDLSGGRLTLGVGGGWQEREHTMFGLPLLEKKARFERFQEGLEVVTQLVCSDEPVTFEGKYFQVRQGVLLPRPARPAGPKILVGGNGEHKTLALAARYADEWNSVYLTVAEWKRKNALLDDLLRAEGRDPRTVERSMMTGIRFGATPEALQQKLAGGRNQAELRQRGLIVGAGAEVKEQLAELEAAGLQRIMLQWLDLDDIEGLQALGKAVL
jgi:F420-dependent oxidoreductase-like protein